MSNAFIIPWKGKKVSNCPYNFALAMINWCATIGQKEIRLPFYLNEEDTEFLFSLYKPSISIVRNDNKTTSVYHIPSICNERDEAELILLQLTFKWHIASFTKNQKYREWTVWEDFLIEPLQELGYPIKGGKLVYEPIP